MADRILRFPEVKALTGLARSTIYYRIQHGDFPAPIKLGPRTAGFIESEVHAWLDKCIERSRGAA